MCCLRYHMLPEHSLSRSMNQIPQWAWRYQVLFAGLPVTLGGPVYVPPSPSLWQDQGTCIGTTRTWPSHLLRYQCGLHDLYSVHERHCTTIYLIIVLNTKMIHIRKFNEIYCIFKQTHKFYFFLANDYIQLHTRVKVFPTQFILLLYNLFHWRYMFKICTEHSSYQQIKLAAIKFVSFFN